MAKGTKGISGSIGEGKKKLLQDTLEILQKESSSVENAVTFTPHVEVNQQEIRREIQSYEKVLKNEFKKIEKTELSITPRPLEKQDAASFTKAFLSIEKFQKKFGQSFVNEYGDILAEYRDTFSHLDEFIKGDEKEAEKYAKTIRKSLEKEANQALENVMERAEKIVARTQKNAAKEYAKELKQQQLDQIEDNITSSKYKSKQKGIGLKYYPSQESYRSAHNTDSGEMVNYVDNLVEIVELENKISADAEITAQKATTAVKRFFSSIGNQIPILAEWKDSMIEAVESGTMAQSDAQNYNGHGGAWAWEVEETTDGKWYVHVSEVKEDYREIVDLNSQILAIEAEKKRLNIKQLTDAQQINYLEKEKTLIEEVKNGTKYWTDAVSELSSEFSKMWQANDQAGITTKLVDKSRTDIKETQKVIEGIKSAIPYVDEKGIFSKYLLGKDGNIKSATQLTSEVEQEIAKVRNKFYQDLQKGIEHSDEDYIAKLEQTFRKIRSGGAFGLFDINNIDAGIKQYYDKWREKNNRWLKSSDSLSDDAFAHYGQLIEYQERLNAMQRNGGEDYIKYLSQAERIHEEIGEAQQRNAKFQNTDFEQLDITQEDANKRAEGLQKEADALNELITSANEFIKVNKEFDIDSSPLYWDKNSITGLQTMSKMLEGEAEKYKNYTRNKRQKEVDIFSNATNDMLGSKSGYTKDIEREWENIEDAILEGKIKGVEAIEAFENKAKELGYTFDETAKKWQKIQENTSNNNIDSYEKLKNVLSEMKEIYDKIQRPTRKYAYEEFAGNLSNKGIIDTSDYRDTYDESDPKAEKLKNKLTEIYKLYKNIGKAIKENNGWYKGEQYNNDDLEALIQDWKAYAQAYHDLREESIAPEGMKSLDEITTKMTKDFKGYSQEVQKNSQEVRESNKLYQEEQIALQKNNHTLEERYNLLKNILVDTAIKGNKDKNALQDNLPFIYSDYDLKEWGKVGDINPKTINVLEEIAKIMGIEIPQSQKREQSNAQQYLEQIEKQLKTEREKLKVIQEQAKANETRASRLKEDPYEYFGFKDRNIPIYDTDKLWDASNRLNKFNPKLEKRSDFESKIKELFDIIEKDYISEHGINSGLYNSLDDFIKNKTDLKYLQRLSKNSIKGERTKDIESALRRVVTDLQSDGRMTSSLIGNNSVYGAKISKEIEEAEIEIGQTRQKLFEEEQAQLHIINQLQQKKLDLLKEQNNEQKQTTQESKQQNENSFTTPLHEQSRSDQINFLKDLQKITAEFDELEGKANDADYKMSKKEEARHNKVSEAYKKYFDILKQYEEITVKLKNGESYNITEVNDPNEWNTRASSIREITFALKEQTDAQDELSKSNEHSNLFQDKSGQLSFIEGLAEAEERATSNAKKLADATAEVDNQINRQMSIDDLEVQQQQAEERLLPAVVETNDAYKERMRIIDQAFQATIGQTNEAQINRDIVETLEQRRKAQEKLNETTREGASITSVSSLSGDEALVQFCEDLDKTTAKANMTQEALDELYASGRKLNDANSSLDLLTDLQTDTSKLVPSDLVNNIDKVLEKIKELGFYAQDLKKAIGLLKGGDFTFDFIDGKGTDQTEKIKKLIDLLKQLGLEVNATSDDEKWSTNIKTRTQAQIDAANKTAEATAEEADNAKKAGEAFEKASTKKDKFTRSNQKASPAAKETAQSTEKEAETIEEVGEAADKASDKINQYLRSQRGDAKSGQYSIIQALNKVEDKRVSYGIDADGNQIKVEELRINYDKLIKEMVKADTAIIKLQDKINNATAAEQPHLRENLRLTQEKLKVYEELLDTMIGEPTYAVTDYQKQTIDAQRALNREYVKNELAAKNAAKANKQQSSQADKANQDALQHYKRLQKQVLEYITLREKANNGQLEKGELARWNELNANFNKVNNNAREFAINTNSSSKATEKLLRLQKELSNIYNNVNPSKNEFILKDLSEKERKNILNSTKKFMDLNPADYGNYKSQLTELQSIIKEINENGLNLALQDDIQRFNKINQIVKEIGNNLKKNKVASQEQIKDYQSQIRVYQSNNTAMGREFKDKFDDLYNLFGLAKTDDEMKQLIGRFHELKGEVAKTGRTGNSLFTDLRKQIRSANAQFLRMYFSWMDWVRYIRTAFNTVRELDSALLDLKKTTTMNNSDLEEFYQNASNIAKETGVTTKEIISQAAAWSRLGFSSKEAAESMAQLSSQFAKISPGTSVEDATDYLVSTMKAFHIDVSEVESEIMDSINRIGNTMATSNQEIGEMLKRSSAAMSEANNSLAETIALESAAVQITRNAETTGTAFRTISMRIRGLDEETEEALEDFDALKGKIADLTKTAKTPGGISLFTDETKTTYKSTYQLLKDIAEIYHDLTDKEQAELLETLAGKRGGQVLAGVLSNFKEVERAMNEIGQSAGSAEAEMGIVAETLDYKLNNLKETWTGIISNLGNRNVLGGLIDSLTKISELISNMVANKDGIITLFSAISAGIMGVRGTGFQFLNDGKNIKGANLFGLGYVGNRDFLNQQGIFKKADIDLVKQYANGINTATNRVDLYNQTIGTGSQALKDYYSRQVLAGKSTALIANEMRAASVSIDFTSIAMNALNFAISGLVTMAVTTAISAIASAFNDWTHEVENTIQAANKLRDAFSNAKKEADSNLETFDSLSKRFEILSKGVDNLGHNLSLTDKEYEEYRDIVKTIADMSPSLVQGYNDQNDAIIRIKDSVGELREEYIEAQKAAYDSIILGNPEDPKSGAQVLVDEFKNSTQLSGAWELGKGKLDSRTIEGILTYIRDEFDEELSIEENQKMLDDYIKKEFGYDIIKGANEVYEFLYQKLDYANIKQSDNVEGIKTLANSLISSYQKDQEDSLNKFKQLFEGYLKGSSSEYYDLSEISQQLVSSVINNIDRETAEELADRGSNAVAAWVSSQVDFVKQIPLQIQKAMNYSLSGVNIDTKEKLNINQIKDYYNQVIDYLVNDPNGPQLKPGEDGYEWVIYYKTVIDENSNNLDRLYNKLFGKSKGRNGNKVLDASQWEDIKKKYADVFGELTDEQIKSLLESDLDFTDMYDNIDVVIKRIYDYLQKDVKEKDPITLTNWLSTSVNGADSEDSKTRQDLINDYYSFLSNIASIRDQIDNGDGITIGDLLGDYPDLQPYIDKYDDFSEAIDKYILDKYDELKEKNGDYSNIVGAAEFWTKVVDETNKALNSKTLTPLFDSQATVNDAVQTYEQNTELWLNGLASSYAKLFEDKKFNYKAVDKETVSNIKKDFKNLENSLHINVPDEEMDKFVSIITDSKTTTEQAQQAFDDYATALFNAANGLKDINEENAEYMKKLFKDNGLDADKAVDEYVAYQKELNEQVEQQRELVSRYNSVLQEQKDANDGLTDSSAARLVALEEERKGIERLLEENQAAAIELMRLKAIEAGIDLNHINTATDVEQILNIANACGVASESLMGLERVLAGRKKVDQYKNSYAYTMDVKNLGTEGAQKKLDKMLANYTRQAQNETNKLLNQGKREVSVGITAPTSADKDAAGSAGKDAADAYMDAYNKELEALKWLKDQNYLTEAEYLEKFRELYQKYFGDLSKYAKEYYEAEKEYYEQKIALQQKAINAVIRLLDRQIKEQEKLRDAEKKEYEEQKKNNEKKIKELEKIIKKYDKQIKQLQKEQKLIRKQNIEPLEEQIKSRQKVIDSLNEEIELMERANEARQDEINLQKAQYELERARHQRTQLVYTEDTGFGQMRYRANPDSVKDAQEAYDNAVYEHRLKIKRDEVQAIQDEIDKYQKEIDKYNEQIELIDKKIEKLEDEKEIVQERIEKYQEENEKLDEIIEKIDERYQKEIDRIEEYKQKWQELLEIQEQIEDLEVLSSLDLDISSLINLDPSVFDAFKDKYTETLSHLYDANQHYADAFNDALDKGLELNTDKMHGLEQAADQLRNTLSDVDGSGSGGGSGGGGGGLRLTKTPEVIEEIDQETQEATEDAKEGIEANTEALDEQFKNTDTKLLLLEKRTQDDFARSKLGFSDCKTIVEAIDKVLDHTVESLEKAAEASKKIADNLKDTKGLDIKVINPIGLEEGTVGNAFASGYPGLKSSEVALRSEYGQPELTVYPNGKYELTTEPTMSKLPKDTVIFNEEQTRRILKNGKKGNSFAEGTGLKSLEEVMPDKAELFSKFEANLSNNMSTIQSSLDIISRNTAEINSNLASKITNNNVGMSYVNNGDINITCPGVTSQEVLDSITEQLNSTFFGMANNSYQRAMKRG